MSQVLYRKYRSQTFDELIGQEHVTKILKNAVKTNKISHAFLFVGSRGTGKTSAARILAKALNCLDIGKDGNPCNKCSNCLSINNGTFLDLIEIDAASNRGIDQIRDIKEKIEFTPSEGKFKIYIIDEVHMLTNEAFNALLKTLEEPPKHVIFILATTEVHKLPSTIISRCQRYDFKLGTDDQIKACLLATSKGENVELESGAVKLLVENASGSYRDALSLLDVVISGQLSGSTPQKVTEKEVRSILGIPDSTMVYVFLENLAYNKGKDAIDLLNELNSKGVNLQQYVKQCLIMLREILVKKISLEDISNEYSFAVSWTETEILKYINNFIQAERNIKNLSIPVLALEMLIPQLISNSEVSNTKTAKNVKESKIPNNKDESNINQSVVSRISEAVHNITDKVIVIDKELVEDKKNKETSKDKEDQNIKLDINIIKGKWKDVTQAIKIANGHLFAFLEIAEVISFEDNTLLLKVPYDFHKDRIEAIKSKEAIQEIFKQVYGKTFMYKCEVSNDNPVRKIIDETVEIVAESQAKEKKELPEESNIDKESPKKFFRKGLGKEVEEIFAGL